MLHAILREIASPEQRSRIKIADCRFDRQCVADAPIGTLAVGQSEACETVLFRKPAYIIDFTLLQP